MKIELKSLTDKIKAFQDAFNRADSKNKKLIYFNLIINELNTSANALIQMRKQIDNMPEDPEQITHEN